MVCNALVACGRLLGAEQQAMRPWWGNLCDLSHKFPHHGRIACCSALNNQPPATKTLHTICGNNTTIVSSSWWWAYEGPKHVEQIIIAIKHSVASSWFSSLRSTFMLSLFRPEIYTATWGLCAQEGENGWFLFFNVLLGKMYRNRRLALSSYPR
jgi:hypothetical protein